jgi:hypothetical protein
MTFSKYPNAPAPAIYIPANNNLVSNLLATSFLESSIAKIIDLAISSACVLFLQLLAC